MRDEQENSLPLDGSSPQEPKEQSLPRLKVAVLSMSPKVSSGGWEDAEPGGKQTPGVF